MEDSRDTNEVVGRVKVRFKRKRDCGKRMIRSDRENALRNADSGLLRLGVRSIARRSIYPRRWGELGKNQATTMCQFKELRGGD